MECNTLIYEPVEDRVFRLTLNRPEKLNAMSGEMLKELDRVFDEFERDDAASVLVIRGAGRAFSAGYDLGAVSGKTSKNVSKNFRFWMIFEWCSNALFITF